MNQFEKVLREQIQPVITMFLAEAVKHANHPERVKEVIQGFDLLEEAFKGCSKWAREEKSKVQKVVLGEQPAPVETVDMPVDKIKHLVETLEAVERETEFSKYHFDIKPVIEDLKLNLIVF